MKPHILSDLHGKPCIKGTRIPAALILGYVADSRSTEDILREFPDISADDVIACLKYGETCGCKPG